MEDALRELGGFDLARMNDVGKLASYAKELGIDALKIRQRQTHHDDL